jgi:hypothetical protein
VKTIFAVAELVPPGAYDTDPPPPLLEPDPDPLSFEPDLLDFEPDPFPPDFETGSVR